jgi:hypothetical protein
MKIEIRRAGAGGLYGVWTDGGFVYTGAFNDCEVYKERLIQTMLNSYAELVEAARDALSALAVIDHVAHFYRGRLPKRARETLFDALTCAAWGDLRAAVAAAERTGEPPMR